MVNTGILFIKDNDSMNLEYITIVNDGRFHHLFLSIRIFYLMKGKIRVKIYLEKKTADY